LCVIDKRALPLALGVGVFFASFVSPLVTPWNVVHDVGLLRMREHTLLILLALLSGLAATVVHRWIWPLCVIAVAGWLLLSVWPPVVVTSFYAALRSRGRVAGGLYLVTAVVLVGVPGAVATPLAADLLRYLAIFLSLMVVIPFTAGLWVRTRRQLIDELRARNATLAAQARAQERTRIAREMHDMVAHRVALIVLHAGGLAMRAPDERTAQEAELIRTAGREALNELRHLLGLLRESGQAPAAQGLRGNLDELVEQTQRAGVPVELKVEGDTDNLPITLERGVYRLVQEALTNVVKHAPGAGTEVLVRNASGFLEVTIRNGPGAPSGAEQAAPHLMTPSNGGDMTWAEPLPSSGLGLIGLRERTDLLGGQFEAAPLPEGGFQVRARLPVEGAVLQLPGEDVRRAV
jgi:signal transduction histidine kinase